MSDHCVVIILWCCGKKQTKKTKLIHIIGNMYSSPCIVSLCLKMSLLLFAFCYLRLAVEDVLLLYCDHYGRPLALFAPPFNGLHCSQTRSRDNSTHAHTHKAKSGREKRGEREEETTGPPGYLHHRRSARMKHRSPSEQHQGKDSRVSPAAASASHEDTMEDRTPSNPRELTQNPLKKIWMPCKNGLPEKHISQRKGAYDNVAAVASIRA